MIATQNIPTSTTVALYLTSENAPDSVATGGALSGTVANATATCTAVNFPFRRDDYEYSGRLVAAPTEPRPRGSGAFPCFRASRTLAGRSRGAWVCDIEVAIPQCDLSRWVAALLDLSALICVHRRPVSGFDFRVGPEEEQIWPPMNADQRR
jgi:hypothetical protein